MRKLALLLVLLSGPPALAQEKEPTADPNAPKAEEAGKPSEAAPATDPAAAPTPAVETVGASAEATGSVRYDKGFVLSVGDDYELKIVGRVQSRWDMTYSEEEGEVADHFSIFRARLTLEGHVFGSTDYKFQTEFGKGFVFLRDFYLDQPIGDVRLRVGQWKKPYSRQQITSSGYLQFVDRSVTDAFSGAGRDIGVAIHDGYEKSPEVEWAVGVFNGTGDRPSIACDTEMDAMGMLTTACANPSNVPPDIGPTMVARVGYNLGPIKGYSEGDLEGGPFRLSLGASYMVDLAEGKGSAMTHRVEGDFMIKVMGASVTGGAYFLSARDATTNERGSDFGFHLQAGYFISPEHVEVAGRFGMIPAADDDLLEALACLGWYFHGHALKWQTEAGVLHTTSDPTVTEVVVRSQAQLIF